MRKIFLAAFLFIILAPVLRAQDTTATILGRVTDQQGAVIPGAKISIVNTSTGVTSTAMTNASGNYQVINLQIGRYKVTAEGDGLQAQIIVDFFNVFNSAQFQAPDTNISDTTFGEITASYDPRIMQLAARITF